MAREPGPAPVNGVAHASRVCVEVGEGAGDSRTRIVPTFARETCDDFPSRGATACDVGCAGLSRTQRPFLAGNADAPNGILQERLRASRLPSVPSALCGLDPRHALPMISAFIEASAGPRHFSNRRISWAVGSRSGTFRAERRHASESLYRRRSGASAAHDAGTLTRVFAFHDAIASQYKADHAGIRSRSA